MKNVFKILLILATTYCAQSLASNISPTIKQLQDEKDAILNAERYKFDDRITKIKARSTSNIEFIKNYNDYTQEEKNILTKDEIDRERNDTELAAAELNINIKERTQILEETIQEMKRLEELRLLILEKELLLEKKMLERTPKL